jgi:AmmeMemoRadiSam system protein A
MIPEITEEQGRLLLLLARETIGSRLGAVGESSPEAMHDPVFQRSCGTFITIKSGGNLRGCIGNLEGTGDDLVESVRRNALSAAFNDHRFSPLTPEEFPAVDLELSILTEPQRLDYPDPEALLNLLRPGVDGVILQAGKARATFLPQVWDQIPDPEQFLSHLSQKAGLDPAAWKTQSPEIYRYQVQSFKERST